MDTFQKLGELLLNSVPTIIFLLIVWVAYRSLVQKKLAKVLADRHARTEGAMEEAQAQISKAEARAAEYEQRFRDARSQAYQLQEARRRQIMEKRQGALAEARRQADEMVSRARADLQRDVNEAQAALDRQAEALAGQVIDSILRPLVAMEGR